MQRHGEVCLSEQYVKCALPSCLVRVLIGYTDPSRSFHVNEETTLYRKVMYVASGSAAPALRYFCSQAHCEEGKEDHEVTMKEYKSELAQKEMDLADKEEKFDVAHGQLVKKTAEAQQDVKRERDNHQLKLRALMTEVRKRNRPLKEMEEVVEREIANLQRIFRKKELEIGSEIAMIGLQLSRENDRLHVRRIDLNEEREAFVREQYARDEKALQEHLLRLREEYEKAHKNLLETRKGLLNWEEREKSLRQKLNAINAESAGEIQSNQNETGIRL